jgi:hypothetical protein
MTLVQIFWYKFDSIFRRKKFSRAAVLGFKSEILIAIQSVKAHIKIEEEYKSIEVDIFESNSSKSNSLYEKLNRLGFNSWDDYMNKALETEIEPELDHKLMDIFNQIIGVTYSKEQLLQYKKNLEDMCGEIECSIDILEKLETMAKIFCGDMSVSNLNDIDELFVKNDCAILLKLPRVLNLSKALEAYYRV